MFSIVGANEVPVISWWSTSCIHSSGSNIGVSTMRPPRTWVTGTE